MPHTVVIIEPGELPRYIANVRSLRSYKNNPNAIIDPKNIPTKPVKYWKKGKNDRTIEVKTSKKDKDAMDAKVAEKQAKKQEKA